MTCKDCIHYDVCRQKYYHMYESYSILDAENIENVCKSFKDKNKYIELPCNVGDSVYTIVKIRGVNPYVRQEIVQFIAYQYGGNLKHTTVHTNYAVYNAKDVFLTKSEAEQKLKELKENA